MEHFFQNSDHIFRYSNVSDLGTILCYKQIHLTSNNTTMLEFFFPNTKLFGKFYFLALERKKKFSEQFSVRKILKITLFNSDLNLPPLLNLNLRIDMDAIQWLILTFKKLRKIKEKKYKKNMDLPGIELTAGEEFLSAARRFTIVPRGLHIRSQ